MSEAIRKFSEGDFEQQVEVESQRIMRSVYLRRRVNWLPCRRRSIHISCTTPWTLCTGRHRGVEMRRWQRIFWHSHSYIREHYTENLSLSQVAEKLGVSNGYLSTLLNQNMGCGFVDYLNQIRIDWACCYLRQSYLKNYEIAYKVGFQDEKYFSKVFKKVIGMTPKEYRMGSK